MDIAAFYLLASVVTLSAICVITAKNPVHSVLFLILCFFTSAGLLVLIGAEFLAMLLVVVYVGAVAVLFLFVVMMLDVDFVELKQGTLRYWPFASLVGIVLAAEIMLVSVAPGGAAPQIVSRVQATALEGQTLAYLAEAVDRDGDAVTFALEGRDADQFAFDPDSADKIVFKAPVDRAFPADENKDNVYDVTLVASDGDQSTQQALSIRVVGPADRLSGTFDAANFERPARAENAKAIGAVMYTEYLLLFQLAGLILLIAMIGAIVLTLRERPGVKRQDVAAQTARTRKDAIELIDVKPGQGI